MTETALVKIDHKEFGLEESKATEIANQFKPMLLKMQELQSEYNEVLKLPLKESETAKKAKELRQKYVKVRTGTAEIHKNQKAFYLAGGRFVDGWKNAQIFASQGIEDTLLKIEKYQENLEKERIEKIYEDRKAELLKYSDEGAVIPQGLGTMAESIWLNFLTGTKINYETRKEAEKKAEADRIENERLDRIAGERRFEIAPYAQFNQGNHDLRNMSDEDYSNLLASLVDAKKVYEKEQEEIRLENERLRKEAEAKEIENEKERKRIADERAKEAKIQAEKEAKSEAERKRLQAEIDAKNKAEAEAKAEFERLEAAAIKEAQKLAKAPIKKQLSSWVDSFEIPSNPLKEANPVADEIIQKFNDFKKWSESQINKI